MKLENIKPFGRYIRYLRINKNSSFLKSIPLDCRLFYLKKGIGKIKIDDTILILNTGCVLFINSFIPYTILTSEAQYLAINFDFTDKYSNLSTPLPPIHEDDKSKIKPIEHIEFENASCFNKYLLCEGCTSLYDIFESAEREFTEKPPFFQKVNSNQITNILIHIFRKNEFFTSENAKFNAKEISNYIENNLCENLSNNSLSKIFHFHPNYLSSKFAEYYGKTLHSYILEMRIIKSITYLEEDFGSIKEIAEKVGFYDNNYFSRYFKKVTGISPTNYIHKIDK